MSHSVASRIFQSFFSWFSEDLTSKLKRSQIRRQFVLGDSSMRREPGSYQRSVALASVHVNVSINVLAVAMDDVFTSGCVVLFKWHIRPKAVSIDCQRLLLAVSQQESDCRFIGVFRWYNVPFTGATICENKHRWFVFFISFHVRARGHASATSRRARPLGPAFTYSSSISTGPSRCGRGASIARKKRWTRR